MICTLCHKSTNRLKDHAHLRVCIRCDIVFDINTTNYGTLNLWSTHIPLGTKIIVASRSMFGPERVEVHGPSEPIIQPPARRVPTARRGMPQASSHQSTLRSNDRDHTYDASQDVA